jgi:Uncharacterized protein conserved in bacteria
MEEGGVCSSLCFFMIEQSLVKEIAEDFLNGSESYLINVEVKPGNAIVVEIDNDQSVNVEECIALNKYIESRLDRDKEDFELEVGSYGISQPFKIPRQYRKYIGKEVEVLTKAGMKYTGILKGAEENGIVLTIEKQIKPEGAKRKITVEEDLSFAYEELKYTKYLIRFK